MRCHAGKTGSSRTDPPSQRQQDPGSAQDAGQRRPQARGTDQSCMLAPRPRRVGAASGRRTTIARQPALEPADLTPLGAWALQEGAPSALQSVVKDVLARGDRVLASIMPKQEVGAPGLLHCATCATTAIAVPIGGWDVLHCQLLAASPFTRTAGAGCARACVRHEGAAAGHAQHHTRRRPQQQPAPVRPPPSLHAQGDALDWFWMCASTAVFVWMAMQMYRMYYFWTYLHSHSFM